MPRTPALSLAVLFLAVLTCVRFAAAGPARPAAGQAVESTTLATFYPDSGYYAKDFAFVYGMGQFHVFYIRHKLGVPDDSTENDLGHAVWSPTRGWMRLAPVLHVRPGCWDDLHVWAPSIVYDDSSSTWFMYYTGVTRVPFAYSWYQRIGVATSQDLEHWTRYDEPVFSGNMAEGVFSDSSQYAGCQFRDPYVMPDPDSGGRDWLMYYAATPQGPTSQLITHVARNHRGLTPWQSVQPLWNTDYFLGGAQAHYVGFTESPHVFEYGGNWYLFYSSNSTHRINFQYAGSPLADSSAWSSQHRLFTVMQQDTASDHWYASECLQVDGHQYFAYINDLLEAIEFREMVWTNPWSFWLTRASVLGVGDAPSAAAAPELALTGGALAGAPLGVRLVLPWAATARVTVFDVAGRARRTLRDGPLPRGVTSLSWDLRDDAGRAAEPGVYFVRLVTPGGARSARAVVLR